MEKRTLSTVEDIELLIDTFYDRILKHEALSYFFSDAVKNWDFHKQQFVRYWSSQILFTDTYEGSPLGRHVFIDNHFEHKFRKEHFDDWARVWAETVDDLFEGEKADLAKESGVNMARNIYLKMFVNRRN